MRPAPLPVSPPEIDPAEHAEMLRRDPQRANPPDWRVDWADGPWPVKVYSGGVRIPLGRAAPLDRLLLYTAGTTAVRVDPSGGVAPGPGDPAPAHPVQRYATRRPIPSGGAMYPTELYVVDVAAGAVHHYDPYRHELVDLAHPAPSAALRAAFGLRATAPLPATVLLLTNRVWKNFYKYGDFAHRLGAVDTGVALGRAVRLGGAGYGSVGVRVNFADAVLDDLLGLDGREEAVFAALELGPALEGSGGRGATRGAPPPVIERSRRIRRSPRLESIAASARVAAVRPEPTVPADPGPLDLLDPATMVRRGSHGRRFTGDPVTRADAVAVLRHAAYAAAALSAVSGGLLGGRVAVHCAAQRIGGVEPGWYRFDGDLTRLAGGDPGREVQQALFTGSLNAELAAFTVHVAGPVDFAGGARTYRARQLGIGAVVEAVSLAASALRLSGHAVLGFDVDRIDRAYGLFGGPTGVQAQVSVGRVRPSTNWETTVGAR